MRPPLPGYRLDRLLGVGGTGEVWLAAREDPALGPVALKRLRPDAPADAVAALRAEAAVLASIDHPNLVRVLDVVADGAGPALVLEHVGEGSLRDLFDQSGTLTAGEVLAVLGPVAEALGELHRHGLAHGDLKPEHVLFAADGRPVLIDVGGARLVPGPAMGGLRGTPAYLDPALATGRGHGAAADLFALGVIAYEALTGRLPHRGTAAEALALAAAGVHRPLASWPTVSTDVAEVVEQLLDPDPAGRPAGPDAVLASLSAAVPTVDRCRRPPRVAVSGVAGFLTAGHATVVVGDGARAAALAPAPTRRLLRALAAVAVALAGLAVALGLGGLGRGPAGEGSPGRGPDGRTPHGAVAQP